MNKAGLRKEWECALAQELFSASARLDHTRWKIGPPLPIAQASGAQETWLFFTDAKAATARFFSALPRRPDLPRRYAVVGHVSTDGLRVVTWLRRDPQFGGQRYLHPRGCFPRLERNITLANMRCVEAAEVGGGRKGRQDWNVALTEVISRAGRYYLTKYLSLLRLQVSRRLNRLPL